LQRSGQFDERSFGAMGTSTAHRSPATPEWEQVRELYRQPNPLPGEVVGRIVAALSPETRQQMRGPSVAYDLDALLSGSYQVATQGLSELLAGAQAFAAAPAVSLAALLRDQAQQRIIEAQVSSRFGELALDALSNTVMDVAAGGRGILRAELAQVEANFGRYFTERNLTALGERFLDHDFDQIFRYFVARDIGDFVGTEAFPSVSHSSRLLDEVARYCRDTTTAVSLAGFEDQLQESVQLTTVERIKLLEPVVAEGITAGLDVLAGGA